VAQQYKDRLKLPIDVGGDIELTTENGLILATGYNRIVIGERGPYVEFNRDQIVHENISVPDNQHWRLKHDDVYYNEYRSVDYCSVKIYEQRKLVDYADYRIGMWYISPFQLWAEKYGVLIDPLRKK
jgi:hypothetical protein